MKTATEWAHEIDSYVTACMNEDTEYKGIGAFSPHPLEDFVKAIRQEQREACAEAIKQHAASWASNKIYRDCVNSPVINTILRAGRED